MRICYLAPPFAKAFARMAELVDALVSNTNGSNTVPVRLRLRVQKPQKFSGAFLFFPNQRVETLFAASKVELYGMMALLINQNKRSPIIGIFIHLFNFLLCQLKCLFNAALASHPIFIKRFKQKSGSFIIHLP